jgi:hypothetical protein
MMDLRIFGRLLRGVPRAPDLSLNEEKTRAFDAMLASALARNGVIEYDAPYPKHEFLSYMVKYKKLLLHGSNNPNIKYMIPVRMLREADKTRFDNLDAVYATGDGIWPIFYAVANRKCPHFSVRTTCFRAADETGRERTHYYFSIDREMLKGQPWVDATIYLLPSDTFRQLRNTLGEPLEEWASDESVSVLAKLPVTPADFPFLDAVRTHSTEAEHSIERAQAFDAYAGRYELAPNLILDVTKIHDTLFAKLPGYPPVNLYPTSEAEFQTEIIDARITFKPGKGSGASQLTLHLEGLEIPARRIG